MSYINRDCFTSSYSFHFFFTLAVPANTACKMFNCGERRHPCLVLDFRGKFSFLYHLEFWETYFIRFRKFSSISLLNVFLQESVLNLVQCFYYIYTDGMWVVYFILCILFIRLILLHVLNQFYIPGICICHDTWSCHIIFYGNLFILTTILLRIFAWILIKDIHL